MPECKDQRPKEALGSNPMGGALGPSPKTILPSWSSVSVMGGAASRIFEMPLGSFSYNLFEYLLIPSYPWSSLWQMVTWPYPWFAFLKISFYSLRGQAANFSKTFHSSPLLIIPYVFKSFLSSHISLRAVKSSHAAS